MGFLPGIRLRAKSSREGGQRTVTNCNLLFCCGNSRSTDIVFRTLVVVSRFAIRALKEVQMKQRIAKLAAVVLLVGSAALAPSAFARDSFAVSIGVPGFGFGYSNRGYGYAYVAP